MLDSVATILKDFPDIAFKICGHTDRLGRKAYNDNLSLERARAVLNYLASKNIDTSRIQCMGKGSLNPIALEKTQKGKDIPEGRALNRRVELSFTQNRELIIQNILPIIPARLKVDK